MCYYCYCNVTSRIQNSKDTKVRYTNHVCIINLRKPGSEFPVSLMTNVELYYLPNPIILQTEIIKITFEPDFILITKGFS
jgi:hypothetical protein